MARLIPDKKYPSKPTSEIKKSKELKTLKFE